MVLVTFGLLSALVPQANASGLVVGYYVPYDANSWSSLQAHISSLDIVMAQWVTIDGCGNLSSRDDQTLKQFAHGRGVRVLPSLFTASAWLDHQVLLNQDAVVAQIVTYTVAEDYDGFDLDLEGADPGDRDALAAFVAQLSDALHQAGKILTLALPAKERDVTTGWSGAVDYTALAPSADLVTIMAYEYRGPFSGAGSVAPIDWVDRVLRYVSATIPAEKTLLGLAFYGYDWNTSTGVARSVGYPQAAGLAESVAAVPRFDDAQQSLTFSYVGLPPPGDRLRAVSGHEVTVREAPPCDVVPPAATVPTARPAAGPSDEHEVWVEDAGSVSARLGLATRYRVAGVASWRLGLEDPQVWPLFDAWRGA